ncbi:MAG: hypothetical protein DRR16_06645 [Candidatus Parabeggiatoa sp. nov. 3]|nr:MAG: hypothetical protein DRR00_14385 [Gammaproteobacteria bacterium]RKZ59498.1 MAG: hypothetical protein DRQ99_23620 [Gammaproteobacteria bacterium]RKZ87747.1 MAG: hypothetical protein DRR16_06645 [Gammaproteobacteria bacterium]
MLRFKTLYLFMIVSLWLSLSPAIAAPNLEAIVDTSRLMLGETLTLKLALSDATAVDQPDFTPLENLFEVSGSQQFHSTQIINGRMSSQIVWQYTLEPQKTGVLTIPALTMKTSAGNLRSQPVQIVVTQTPVKRRDGVRLEATVSNPKPYLHQPILYTLRLYHRGKLRDLEPVLPSDNVLMEQLGKLKQRRTLDNGRQMIVAEITYILTPLRSGQLEIGPVKMKALKQNNNQGFGGSFFNFGSDYRPTTITSSPLTLDVQAPISHPWLPLNDLQLQHKWESDISQPVIAGTPLIWTLTLRAEGMGGQSPPQLETFVQSNADFRVRSPKPEIERVVLSDSKTPVSTITQSFSLIPVNTGTLSLPAIRIPWWDVQNQRQAVVELPAQVIQVKPNQNLMMPTNVMGMASSAAAPAVQTIVNQPVAQPMFFSQAQYAFLIMAVLALLIALVQSRTNRRQFVAVTPVPKTQTARMTEAVFKKRLAAADELAEIKGLIQEYAHLSWQTPKNASLQAIAQHLAVHYVGSQPAADLLQELNAACYGKQAFDLGDWKNRCVLLLSRFKEKKRLKQKAQVVFGPLNPA